MGISNKCRRGWGREKMAERATALAPVTALGFRVNAGTGRHDQVDVAVARGYAPRGGGELRPRMIVVIDSPGTGQYWFRGACEQYLSVYVE